MTLKPGKFAQAVPSAPREEKKSNLSTLYNVKARSLVKWSLPSSDFSAASFPEELEGCVASGEPGYYDTFQLSIVFSRQINTQTER